MWDTTKNTETTKKKQAKVCGQTKIANVALSPSRGEATSTLMHPTVYMIARPCSGIGRNASVQTFFSLLGRLGKSGFSKKANPAKKLSTHESFIVHQAGNRQHQEHYVLVSMPPAPAWPIQG
jgi:hypothetical protein